MHIYSLKKKLAGKEDFAKTNQFWALLVSSGFVICCNYRGERGGWGGWQLFTDDRGSCVGRRINKLMIIADKQGRENSDNCSYNGYGVPDPQEIV